MAAEKAGLEWEDVHMQFKDFGALKKEGDFGPSLPLGSLPVLDLGDGVKHVQSYAMCKFICVKYGLSLYPTDPYKQFLVDEVSLTCDELAGKAPHSKDQVEKKRLREEFANGRMVGFMELHTVIERRIQGPFVLGAEVSVADLSVLNVMGMIQNKDWDYVDPSYLDKYPKILATLKATKEAECVKKCLIV